MRYLLRRRLLWMAVCVWIAATLGTAVPIARADGFNPDLLKTGMTLTDVVQAFGQPNRMEWVNQKGTPVLFLFYTNEDRFYLLCPFAIVLDPIHDSSTIKLLLYV